MTIHLFEYILICVYKNATKRKRKDKKMKKVCMMLIVLAAVCLLLAGCAESGQTQTNNDQAMPAVNICTVTFDTQGGTEIAAQNLEKGSRVQKPQDPEKAGYTFAGWTYSGEDWSFIQHTVTGNMTLTAQWQINTYTVIYTLNGGTNAQSNPITFTVEDETVTLSAPERTGYTFVGWTWEGQTEPQMSVTIPIGTHENKTFAANWTFDGFVVSDEGVLTIRPGVTYIPADIEIPEIYNDKNVKSIGDHAFDGRTELKSIIIPDSVTSIGESVFSGCSSLVSITIPFVGHRAGVTVDDTYQYPFGYLFGTVSYTGGTATEQMMQVHYADHDMMSIRGITYYIPATLRSVTVTGGNILEGAFNNCTGLASITIQGSVTNIGARVFSGSTGLTSITIPDSVTSIGEYVFFGCMGLTSINFTGTKAQWNAIKRNPDWKNNAGSYTVHCTDGDIAKADS